MFAIPSLFDRFSPVNRQSCSIMWLLCLAIPLTFASMTSNAKPDQSPNITRATAIGLHNKPLYTSHPGGFSYVNPKAPKGGDLVLPGLGSFNSLNPYTLKNISPINTPGLGMYGINELNEPLMIGTGGYMASPDEPHSAYCLLCDTLEYPEDFSWVRFTLNPDARFHNGDPITADDVVTSYQLLTSETAHPSYIDKYKQVVSVTKESDRSVLFTFKKPYNKAMIFRAGELPVMSHKFWSKHDFASTTEIAQPLSGPYKISAFKIGSFIEFSRVADHWGAKLPAYQGRFNFNTVRYDFYRDHSVAFQAFKAGKLHVFYDYISKNWATGYNFAAVKDGRVKKEKIQHKIPSGSQAFFINTRKPRFADPRVRKALTLLFDFEWTNKTIFASAYKRSNSYFPNSPLSAAGTKPSPQELALLKPFAKQLPAEALTQPFLLEATQGNGNIRSQLRQAIALFKEAGWDYHNGKLVNSRTLKSFQLEILIAEPSLSRVLTPYLKNLKQAGVDARVRNLDQSQYKRRLDNLNFDMVSYVLPQDLTPNHEQRQYFHSSSASTKGTKNFAGIKNVAVDAMVDAIISASTREELTTATRALDRVLLWHYYSIPNWHIDYHRVAYKKELHRPSTETPLHLGFTSWWFEQ